jgi:hypothetical protein
MRGSLLEGRSKGGSWATDCYVTESRNCLRGVVFQRNTDVYHLSGSPIGDSLTVINMTVDYYDDPMNFHGDIWHVFPTTTVPIENVILYGVTATNWDNQPIFAENNEPSGGARVDNIAFVNWSVSRPAYSAANSWWETNTNHLLLWNHQMGGANGFDMRWKLAYYGATVRNVSIDNSAFRHFTLDPLPVGTRVRNLTLEPGTGFTPPNFWP